MQKRFTPASVQGVVDLFLLCYRYVPEFKCLSLSYVMNMSPVYENLCTGSNIYVKI